MGEVVLTEDGPLGIRFTGSSDDLALVVDGFSKGKNGEKLFAENESSVCAGDVLVRINGKCVIGENGSGRKRAVELFENQGLARPLSLSFTKPYLHLRILDKKVLGNIDPVNELVMQETANNRVLLKDIKNVPGKAEKDGVLIGDHLIFINDIPVGAGCRLTNEAG